ncbi:MAG: response regulator [Spirochaetia bacterium]
MHATLKSKPIEILLVEDNPDDVILTREAFAESKIMNNLQVVENGEEALKYLYRENPYTAVIRPHLILLDLNLPKVSGREVLEKIKRDEKLMDIPVVILTTSKAEEDILRSYRLHANCYISKPVDFGKFMDIVRTIESFWFSVVTLPNNGGEE